MSDDYLKHRPLIQLLLRLMGVFFVIDGLTGVIGNGIDVVYQYRLTAEIGGRYVGSYSLGVLIACAFMTAAGFGLIFKNRMAMDAIFHEQLKEASESESGTP